MRLSSFPRLRFVIWVGKVRSPSGKTRSPFAPHCTFQGRFGSTFSRSEMAWRFCRFLLWPVAVSPSLHISRLLRSDYLVVLMSSGDFVARSQGWAGSTFSRSEMAWRFCCALAGSRLPCASFSWTEDSWHFKLGGEGTHWKTRPFNFCIFAKDKRKIPSCPILLCWLQKKMKTNFLRPIKVFKT